MTLEERISDGITDASDKSWRFRKDLHEIRPEYLLTVGVADQLLNGFDNVDGFDAEIILEARTREVCYKIMKQTVGIPGLLKGKRLKLTREGRFDIFISHQKKSWVIELKGFDPQSNQITKEIERFAELLGANGSNNDCAGCYLAFPAINTSLESIQKSVSSIIGSLPLEANYTEKNHETSEHPEYGIPEFSVYIIKISKIPNLSIVPKREDDSSTIERTCLRVAQV